MHFSEIFDKILFKFLIVGILNTLVGAGIMFILYNVAKCSYWISSACNYIAGGILSYFLNKYFTFKNSRKSFSQIIIYILNLIVCYLIAYVFAKWAIYKIFSSYSTSFKDNTAMFTGMILYTGLNYLGQRFLVFTNINPDKTKGENNE